MAHKNRKISQFVVAPRVDVRSVREVQGRAEISGDSNEGIGGCDGILMVAPRTMQSVHRSSSLPGTAEKDYHSSREEGKVRSATMDSE